MKEKLLLIDGNNLLFKAYHATKYGNLMQTSTGIATNAIYGFINMVQKALERIQPQYVLVAWDSGKPTFRHKLMDEYKGTRKPIDPELIMQMPIAREFLQEANIMQYEEEGIEADDIIGTIAAKMNAYDVTILSSDKDMWQLINDYTKVCFMKKGITDVTLIDQAYLKEHMNIEPKQIIDLKALMGDASDNIPGVKGIGEKGALKLLYEYTTIENIYQNIQHIKGKVKEKLENDQAMAFLSKELATIQTNLSLPISIEQLKFHINCEGLLAFYQKYEMNSLRKKLQNNTGGIIEKQQEQSIAIVEKISKELLKSYSFLWADMNQEHYQDATLYGFGIMYGNKIEYIELENAFKDKDFLQYLAREKNKITYNAKQIYHMLHKYKFEFCDIYFDLQIASFLIDATITDFDKLLEAYQLSSCYSANDIYGKKGKPIKASLDDRVLYVQTQLKNIYILYPMMEERLKQYELEYLFYEVEMPLCKILYKMEVQGICVNVEILETITQETSAKLESLSKIIYEFAGQEFNINSPKQLSEILYDKLELKSNKKRSTAAEVLEKLKDKHPIVPYLIEHRKYSKLYSTYAQGLQKHISADGKIHTIFNQTQTQTGRLSSSDPNLQNISIKDQEGKEIRKAFVAREGFKLLTADYSQIELRMLAHMANEEEMIHAFHQHIDIHTKTAMEIFNVKKEDVSDYMRRCAKTVNFGIVYGQSDFGLSDQLHIPIAEAKDFISRYFQSYPKINEFMNQQITFCETHGYVKTLFQRRRYIPEIHHKNYMLKEFGKRAAMNAPIQGSAADLIKLAMVHIDKQMELHHVQSKMILQIHDELIFEVPDEEVSIMKDIVEKGMQEVLQLSVPLVAEASIAQNWFDTK